MVGCFPIQLGKEEFPYEFVLKTRSDDEQAKELVERMEDEYHVKTQSFPAVNVVSQRGDEFIADRYGNGYNGQGIGIPESVYRQFTGKTLELTGKNIHVVFQQLSSDKAHSVDYYSLGEQSLHFGSGYKQGGIFAEPIPCFRYYKVQGIERNILFGYLGKGYNENVIVFSDEYFEQILDKEIQEDLDVKWIAHRETDLRLDSNEPEKAENYSNSLVLIQAEQKYASDIEKLLKEYEESLPFEKKVQYIYDATVKMYYNSDTLIRENAAERTLKLVTCGLQSVFILFVILYLLYLNINEDYDLKKRQFEFLRCLGVPRKEAANAVLFESTFTAYVPMAIGSVMGLGYAVRIPCLRLYTGAEWQRYLKGMGIVWGIAWLVFVLGYELMKKFMRKRIIA